MDNTRLASSVFKRLFFLMEEPLVPFAFYDKAVQAVAYARGGNGPMLLEVKTYRWYEHCIGDPDLRPRQEREAWKRRDCIALFGRKLMEEGVATQAMIDEMFAEAQAEIEAAVEYGRQSAEPALDSIFEDVYAD